MRWAPFFAVAIFGVTGCVGDSPEQNPQDAATVDAVASDAVANDATADVSIDAVDAGPPGPCDLQKDFGAPALVSGVNGSSEDEFPTLTDDELTIYFASNRSPGGGASFDIWTASRATKNDPFGAPTIVEVQTTSGINTSSDERGPTITGDGRKLFFHSSRSGKYGLYVTERPNTSSAFVAPQAIAELNLRLIQSAPNSRDGTRLAFVSYDGDPIPADAGTPLHEATRVGNVFTGDRMKGTDFTLSDNFPVLSADGLRLFFASNRPAPSIPDVFTATRPSLGQPFGAATRVDGVSSSGQDFPSHVSPDGCRLYLWSDRVGAFKIFVATRPK